MIAKATSPLIFSILLSMLSMNGCTSKVEEVNHYNILFISIDDLRNELGAYGREYFIMPNIDKLASQE